MGVVGQRHPSRVGIGYRAAIDEWTRRHLDRFDVLEVTVDHCIFGGRTQQATIFNLVGRIALNAHGVGLSIGTDAPLDEAYLDQVAAVVDRLKAPTYSEHLAFTRVPGRDLANLLPLPRTEAVASSIIAKVRMIQSRIPVPFLLENITYMFNWPDSDLSDADFLNLICHETGAGLLLDIENLYLNSANHGFDARQFLDTLAPDLIQEIHMAGGITVHEDKPPLTLLADTHSHPVPEPAFYLLDYALARHSPRTIIVERDDRFDAIDEVLNDVARIRSCVARIQRGKVMPKPLLDRQVSLLAFLTSRGAIFGDRSAVLPADLAGIDRQSLILEARFSHEKRMDKILAVFPKTFELMDDDRASIIRDFAEACPPYDISRIENARQFYRFLCERWQRKPPNPPYLRDVAACETVFAEARADADNQELDEGAQRRKPRPGVRRRPGVALLRCAYDIQSIFAPDVEHSPAERGTHLVIATRAGAHQPQVYEVPSVVFELLSTLDDWVDPATLGLAPASDALLHDLRAHGLLEVCG